MDLPLFWRPPRAHTIDRYDNDYMMNWPYFCNETSSKSTVTNRPPPLVVPWDFEIWGPNLNVAVDAIGPETDFTLETHIKMFTKTNELPTGGIDKTQVLFRWFSPFFSMGIIILYRFVFQICRSVSLSLRLSICKDLFYSVSWHWSRWEIVFEKSWLQNCPDIKILNTLSHPIEMVTIKVQWMPGAKLSGQKSSIFLGGKLGSDLPLSSVVN